MVRKTLLSFAFACVAGICFAQTEILPKGFAPGEQELIPAYMESRYANAYNRATILTPPGGDIRTMAGWEEVDAITITWTGFPAILREIVREAQTQCKVIIHCTDSNVVKTNLTNYSVPLTSNLKFIEVAYNSIWIRDYGANTVYRNDVDSIFLVDWIYNEH
jgi:agmatine deiminase